MFVSPYVCLVALTSLYLVSYLDTECYGFHILDYANSDYTSRMKRQSCGFRCANGACVDGDSKCNGISDCADGSDESPQICFGTTEPPSAIRIRRTISNGSCVLPPQPANGTYTSDQSVMKLNYSCSSGYQLYPSPNKNIVTCESGEWYPGLPECLQCGNIMPGKYTFVIEGERTNKGEFPWHVGIYKLNDSNQYEQRCGGTIISRNLIVSAAHCFTKYENGAPYDTKLYAIAAGKYYRNYYEEKDILSQKSTVKKIIIPEQYRGFSTSFTSDIALVIPDKTLEITEVVQPVCIDWNNEFEATQLRDHNNGIVVGWGYTKEGQDPSVELIQLSVPFINFAQCYESVPESFTRFLTNDKLCAGFTNGSGVCHGDSGGGLVFKQEDTKKYYLRGLVSVGPLVEGKCDSRQYGAYTKVSDYIAMLRDVEGNWRLPVTFKSCTLQPNNATGQCVLLKNCPKAIENLPKGIHPQICSYEGTEPVVCCVKRAIGDISKQKLVPPGTTSTDPTPPCNPTVTKINGDIPTCANKLLFEDNFDGNAIDESKWLKEQFIVYSPDYEMVTYQKRPENCYLENKNLVLKATLRSNPKDSMLNLTDGCTSQNCTVDVVSTIPAPIIAGRVKSKFRFKYGKIEIRAQLPRGDWIFPELYLHPHSDAYGPHYASGRMWVAYARGNLDLVTVNGEQIGNSVLYGGPVLGIKEPVRTQAAIKVNGQQPWGAGYHTYTLTWGPDQMEFAVDGENKGTVRPPAGHFSSIQTNDGYSYASEWKTNMAPFDQEFSIILGMGVGGISDFPDNSRSRGTLKPWKNFNIKKNLRFFDRRTEWEPTWEGDNSALKIEYVRVWAL